MVALIDKNCSGDKFCWRRESQLTNFDTWLWNGTMELVDMPGISAICRIGRLGISNPKQARGDLRGTFCVPKEGIPKFWFCDFFVWEVAHSREKSPPLRQCFCCPTNFVKFEYHRRNIGKNSLAIYIALNLLSLSLFARSNLHRSLIVTLYIFTKFFERFCNSNKNRLINPSHSHNLTLGQRHYQ